MALEGGTWNCRGSTGTVGEEDLLGKQWARFRRRAFQEELWSPDRRAWGGVLSMPSPQRDAPLSISTSVPPPVSIASTVERLCGSEGGGRRTGGPPSSVGGGGGLSAAAPHLGRGVRAGEVDDEARVSVVGISFYSDDVVGFGPVGPMRGDEGGWQKTEEVLPF
jgi:hypothetical protein